MTEKRNNRTTEIKTLDMQNQAQVLQELQKVQELADSTGCVVYDLSDIFGKDENGNTTVNFGLAKTHDLQVIPTYSADEDKKLVNIALALTPKFSEVLNSDLGLEYLKQSYFSRVIKKIRDNHRQAILDGKQYHLSTDLSDFLTTTRQPSQSAELREAISNLVKMLVAKFATKLPYAKPLLTIKTMTSALSNEAFAKQVYPFLIGKDGNTILDKWIDSTIADFESRKIATSELIAIKESRHNIVENDSDDMEVDDLF